MSIVTSTSTVSTPMPNTSRLDRTTLSRRICRGTSSDSNSKEPETTALSAIRPKEIPVNAPPNVADSL